jgi:hypothetical protein
LLSREIEKLNLSQAASHQEILCLKAETQTLRKHLETSEQKVQQNDADVSSLLDIVRMHQNNYYSPAERSDVIKI